MHDALARGRHGPGARAAQPLRRWCRSPRYLFVAGGIGITPILPMVAAAEAAGADWRLLYGGRSRASMAFLDELARYGDRVDCRPAGRVRAARPRRRCSTGPSPGTLVYCCGPGAAARAVEERCARWPAGTLHVERFAPGRDESRRGRHGVRGRAGAVGLTVTVPPGTSMLDAVAGAGVSVLFSCREGTCGTCETDVLEGVPDHRDSVLTAEERAAGDTMMICVSRCRGPAGAGPVIAL